MNPGPVLWSGSVVVSGSLVEEVVVEASCVWAELGGEVVMVSASEEVEESEEEVIGTEVKDAGAVSERLSADDVTAPVELKMAVSDGMAEELSALEASVDEVLICVSDATKELDEGTSFADEVGGTTTEEVDGFAAVDSTFGLEAVVGFGASEVDTFSGVGVVFSTTGVVLAGALSVLLAGVTLTGVVLGVDFFFRASTLARSLISTARGMGSK